MSRLGALLPIACLIHEEHLTGMGRGGRCLAEHREPSPLDHLRRPLWRSVGTSNPSKERRKPARWGRVAKRSSKACTGASSGPGAGGMGQQ